MDTTFTHKLSLSQLHRLALDNAFAFVSYRLPNSTQTTTMLQWTKAPARFSNIHDISHHSGFVFAPFDFDSGTPARIIQPDLIIEGEHYFEPKQNKDKSQNETLLQSDYIFADTDNYITTRNEFIAQVQQVKKLINRKTIEKVVLSRISREEKPKNFDSATFFKALEAAYPDAFVFSLYIPDAGLWFGASPEPLMILNNNTVSTVSLAGTRKYKPYESQKEWGEKEKDEQNIVTLYIENIIKKSGVVNLEKTGPASQIAGKIEHLKTTFSFPFDELKGTLFDFINNLHPTPSVCGLPKEISMQIIKNTERHRREYYTGFLGPVNYKSEWNLFVNLRSLKSHGNTLEYYLGAGITLGSQPEEEWEETNNKMNTLKSIIEQLKEL
jgi:isochorismate synthase